MLLFIVWKGEERAGEGRRVGGVGGVDGEDIHDVRDWYHSDFTIIIQVGIKYQSSWSNIEVAFYNLESKYHILVW